MTDDNRVENTVDDHSRLISTLQTGFAVIEEKQKRTENRVNTLESNWTGTAKMLLGTVITVISGIIIVYLTKG